MLALGIDTSNYATSLAVVDTTSREVVSSLKQFLPVKQGEMGLRQSDAVFHHTVALPQMMLELKKNVDLTQVGCVAASEKPRPQEGSYMPCFLAGLGFAAAFACGRGLAVHGTSHQQGHLAAALYGTQAEAQLMEQDILLFHLSGGTTELLLSRGYVIKEKLGGSLDLYAGQAVDRLGVLLGFSFPAGAQLSALAQQAPDGTGPAPKVTVKGMDCHLSGLENQCKKLLDTGMQPAVAARYCLQSIAHTVYVMAQNARKQYGKLPVVCAGGVMGSSVVQGYLTGKLENSFFVPPEFSSDNAVGVALIAAQEECHG